MLFDECTFGIFFGKLDELKFWKKYFNGTFSDYSYKIMVEKGLEKKFIPLRLDSWLHYP